jgi:hypothetical protein
MLSITVQEKKEAEMVGRFSQPGFDGSAFTEILWVTNHFGARLAGYLRRFICRVIINYDNVIDVLENSAYHRSNKSRFTESRNNRANSLPGCLNHGSSRR